MVDRLYLRNGLNKNLLTIAHNKRHMVERKKLSAEEHIPSGPIYEIKIRQRYTSIEIRMEVT